MWPFGKKKEKQTPAPDSRVQEFAQQFQAEELTLVAVTGPDGFGADRAEGEELWTVNVGLTAWMDEFDGVVYRKPARLVALADERLVDYLRQRIPRDFIIKCEVRQAIEGDRFQLVGMPEAGFDPELKAILEEQVKPVTFEDERFGKFVLRRSVNWFEAAADWCGTGITLTMDREQTREDCLQTACALFDAQQDWDGRIRSFAADCLLEQANEQPEAEEADEPAEPVSREEFMERLEPESLEVTADGGFTFWFADGGLFWGRSVQVTGTVAGGPTEAKMEG